MGWKDDVCFNNAEAEDYIKFLGWRPKKEIMEKCDIGTIANPKGSGIQVDKGGSWPTSLHVGRYLLKMYYLELMLEKYKPLREKFDQLKGQKHKEFLDYCYKNKLDVIDELLIYLDISTDNNNNENTSANTSMQSHALIVSSNAPSAMQLVVGRPVTFTPEKTFKTTLDDRLDLVAEVITYYYPLINFHQNMGSASNSKAADVYTLLQKAKYIYAAVAGFSKSSPEYKLIFKSLLLNEDKVKFFSDKTEGRSVTLQRGIESLTKKLIHFVTIAKHFYVHGNFNGNLLRDRSCEQNFKAIQDAFAQDKEPKVTLELLDNINVFLADFKAITKMFASLQFYLDVILHPELGQEALKKELYTLCEIKLDQTVESSALVVSKDNIFKFFAALLQPSSEGAHAEKRIIVQKLLPWFESVSKGYLALIGNMLAWTVVFAGLHNSEYWQDNKHKTEVVHENLIKSLCEESQTWFTDASPIDKLHKQIIYFLHQLDLLQLSKLNFGEIFDFNALKQGYQRQEGEFLFSYSLAEKMRHDFDWRFAFDKLWNLQSHIDFVTKFKELKLIDLLIHEIKKPEKFSEEVLGESPQVSLVKKIINSLKTLQIKDTEITSLNEGAIKQRVRSLHLKFHPDSSNVDDSSNYNADALNKSRDTLIEWLATGKSFLSTIQEFFNDPSNLVIDAEELRKEQSNQNKTGNKVIDTLNDQINVWENKKSEGSNVAHLKDKIVIYKMIIKLYESTQDINQAVRQLYEENPSSVAWFNEALFEHKTIIGNLFGFLKPLQAQSSLIECGLKLETIDYVMKLESVKSNIDIKTPTGKK